MFGIFTHAQLGREQFWDSLSQQQQERGADYVDRCTFRTKPLSAGDNVILPAFFPPLPHQVQGIPQTTPLVKVREEDLNNVSEMAGWSVSNITSACALDLFHARVRPLSRRRDSSQFTRHVTRLDKFVTLSQVTSFGLSWITR